MTLTTSLVGTYHMMHFTVRCTYHILGKIYKVCIVFTNRQILQVAFPILAEVIYL